MIRDQVRNPATRYAASAYDNLENRWKAMSARHPDINWRTKNNVLEYETETPGEWEPLDPSGFRFDDIVNDVVDLGPEAVEIGAGIGGSVLTGSRIGAGAGWQGALAGGLAGGLAGILSSFGGREGYKATARAVDDNETGVPWSDELPLSLGAAAAGEAIGRTVIHPALRGIALGGKALFKSSGSPASQSGRSLVSPDDIGTYQLNEGPTGPTAGWTITPDQQVPRKKFFGANDTGIEFPVEAITGKPPAAASNPLSWVNDKMFKTQIRAGLKESTDDTIEQSGEAINNIIARFSPQGRASVKTGQPHVRPENANETAAGEAIRNALREGSDDRFATAEQIKAMDSMGDATPLFNKFRFAGNGDKLSVTPTQEFIIENAKDDELSDILSTAISSIADFENLSTNPSKGWIQRFIRRWNDISENDKNKLFQVTTNDQGAFTTVGKLKGGADDPEVFARNQIRVQLDRLTSVIAATESVAEATAKKYASNTGRLPTLATPENLISAGGALTGFGTGGPVWGAAIGGGLFFGQQALGNAAARRAVRINKASINEETKNYALGRIHTKPDIGKLEVDEQIQLRGQALQRLSVIMGRMGSREVFEADTPNQNTKPEGERMLVRDRFLQLMNTPAEQVQGTPEQPALQPPQNRVRERFLELMKQQ